MRLLQAAFHYKTTNQCNHYVTELFEIKIDHTTQKLKSIFKKIIKINQAVCEISSFVLWALTRWRSSFAKQFFYFTGIC